MFAERGVIPSQRPGGFCLLLFLLELLFTQKTNQQHAQYSIMQSLKYPPPPRNSTMRSPVVTISEGVKEKNQIKKLIGVVYVVKEKVI